jgi:predicted O-linked N-acetylglucosamine transferase (SPINDLY family)
MIPLSHQPVSEARFTRADVGLPDDGVVLACFNNIYKVTPDMFACWTGILARAADTVLWLLDDNPAATAALRACAAASGIDPARLVFSGRSTHAEYREKLTLADIYLDTYPYNAGSTARDVLDAGVPLVTLSGRTPVSRMAGGLLHAAGLDDLIATSRDGYERLVLELCADASRRSTLKARMHASADAWRAAPAKFVRSLEEQLERIVTDGARREQVAVPASTIPT